MSLFLFTLGQAHTLRCNGKTFDCDCVVVYEGNDFSTVRDEFYRMTNGKFHGSYTVAQWAAEDDLIKYFPRGYIGLNIDLDHTAIENRMIAELDSMETETNA